MSKDATATENPVGRILVVGVSGYLGSALALGLRDQFEVFGTVHRARGRIDGVTMLPLDCMNGGEIFDTLKKVRPDAILYCAGVTTADECERNRPLADGLNLKAPALFFKVGMNPVPFVYFSTDNVFHGPLTAGSPFVEGQSTTPVNYYGQTKAQAESMLLSHMGFTHVFRLANLYGETLGMPLRPRGTWLGWAAQLAQRGRSVPFYKDQLRSHLYVGDAVRAVRSFLRRGKANSKIYNLAGPVVQSRLDFGREFFKSFGYDDALIKPALAEGERNHAARPLFAGLSARRFEQEFDFKFQSPSEGLAEMSERLRTGFTRDWT